MPGIREEARVRAFARETRGRGARVHHHRALSLSLHRDAVRMRVQLRVYIVHICVRIYLRTRVHT